MTESPASLRIEPVNADTWRAVARLEVLPDQERFVASGSYYLALCTYGQEWQPLAVSLEGTVIGFLMWAVDPEDDSCWLGGVVIDKKHQGRGWGRTAVRQTMRMLHEAYGHTEFALSYDPANERARRTYAPLGFLETGEMSEDEVVARMTYPDR